MKYEAREMESEVEAALKSMNASGFLREDAVRALQRFVRDGEHVDFALPFLLDRVFDWVDQISGLARDAFLEALPKASAAGVVRLLPLIHRCEGRRIDHQGLSDQGDVEGAVDARLRDPDGMEILRDGLQSSSGAVRSACAIELLGRGADGAHSELLEHPDESIRLRYLSWLGQSSSAPDLTAQLLRLSRDPSSAVRAASLRALAARLGEAVAWEEVTREFHAALCDKVRSVRGIAQFHCRRHEPDLSFANVYREAIAERRTGWLGAVDGLSQLAHTEAERASDDAIFLGLMDDPNEAAPGRAIMARAALESARREDGETVDPQLVEWLHGLLSDPRLPVCSAASKAIEQLGCPPAPEHLSALARHLLTRSSSVNDERVHAEWMPLLRSSRGLGPWPRVSFVLSIPMERLTLLCSRVEAELHRWLHGVGVGTGRFHYSAQWLFPSLSPADVETAIFLEARLQELAPFLDDGTVTGIQEALATPPAGTQD